MGWEKFLEEQLAGLLAKRNLKKSMMLMRKLKSSKELNSLEKWLTDEPQNVIS